jgi:site-specific DNA-methyltransferase (adenine-specific)
MLVEPQPVPQPPAAPVPPAASESSDASASSDEPAPPAGREPYFRDDERLVTIYQADSADLSFLAADSVQLVVTSPPYNLGKDYGTARDDATYHQYLDWVASWGRQLQRVVEPGGRLCLNIPLDINLSFDTGGKRTTKKQPVLADVTHRLVNEDGWLYNTTILWLEGNISRRTAWGSWMKASDPWVNTAAEAVLVLSKERRRRDGRGKRTEITRDEFMEWTLGLWQFRGETSKRWGHPAPFPEELPRRLIRMFSFTDDVVLDPFLGTGTTCRAAKDLGRASIGIEIDPRYCAVAAERCRGGAAVTDDPAITGPGGASTHDGSRAHLLARLRQVTTAIRRCGRSGA